MKYLRLKSVDPYYNLAVEEYLYNNSAEDVFMLWQNEPTVVIGVNQNAYLEVDTSYLEKNNIHLSRRITGGGAVYHDLGNVNYSYIKVGNRKAGIDFSEYTVPIIEALKTISCNAELSGRNDLLVSGKKISGNAQNSKGDRVLHHGTLLFNSDLDVLTLALKVDPDKLSSKAIKSTRSRVANISELIDKNLEVEDFIQVLEEFIVRSTNAVKIDPPVNDEIERLRVRNSSHEWIYQNRELVSKYEIKKKKRFSCGTVELYLEMKNDSIVDIKIFGDFFGTSPIEELCSIIRGCTLKSILERFQKFEIDNYISGISIDEFVELLTK